MYISTFFICKYCIHVIIDPDRRNLSYQIGSARFSLSYRLRTRRITIYVVSRMTRHEIARRVEPNSFERSYYADFN